MPPWKSTGKAQHCIPSSWNVRFWEGEEQSLLEMSLQVRPPFIPTLHIFKETGGNLPSWFLRPNQQDNFKEQYKRGTLLGGGVPSSKETWIWQGEQERNQRSEPTPLPWEVLSQECLAHSPQEVQCCRGAEGILSPVQISCADSDSVTSLASFVDCFWKLACQPSAAHCL